VGSTFMFSGIEQDTSHVNVTKLVERYNLKLEPDE
jgi:hypothetical protein